VIIVGAGDTACEEAIYLSKICNKVTLLVRSDRFKASTIMSENVKSISNIDIRYNTEITEILGDRNVVNGIYTNNNEVIDCDGVFIAIGHTPNSSVFNDYINIDEEGYIIRYDGTTKTNIDGIFSSGDVSDKRYKQAITAAGSGCMSAMDVERFLNGL
jgi:thioredoxin reductase (NADPH)